MGNICDYLACDQKRCDDLFAQVETRVASKNWLQAGDGFQLFDNALARHMHVEETVLFPAFEKTTHGCGEPIAMLLMEHQRIRAVVGRLYDAICRYDPVDFILHAETFALLMQQHNMKEEDMLYPLLDRLLARRTTETVAAMREKLESTIQ